MAAAKAVAGLGTAWKLYCSQKNTVDGITAGLKLIDGVQSHRKANQQRRTSEASIRSRDSQRPHRSHHSRRSSESAFVDEEDSKWSGEDDDDNEPSDDHRKHRGAPSSSRYHSSQSHSRPSRQSMQVQPRRSVAVEPPYRDDWQYGYGEPRGPGRSPRRRNPKQRNSFDHIERRGPREREIPIRPQHATPPYCERNDSWASGGMSARWNADPSLPARDSASGSGRLPSTRMAYGGPRMPSQAPYQRQQSGPRRPSDTDQPSRQRWSGNANGPGYILSSGCRRSSASTPLLGGNGSRRGPTEMPITATLQGFDTMVIK